MPEPEGPDLTALTVQLLSAYVGNNAVPSSELAELIRTTKLALAEEQRPVAPAEPEYIPAVSVKASTASKDHIISLIDGKPYKSLKRHLSTHGLTPAEYRARYNLPNTYPTVAPNYSAQRRAVAKELGLGRKRSSAAAVVAAPASAQKSAPTAKASTSTSATKGRAKTSAVRQASEPQPTE